MSNTVLIFRPFSLLFWPTLSSLVPQVQVQASTLLFRQSCLCLALVSYHWEPSSFHMVSSRLFSLEGFHNISPDLWHYILAIPKPRSSDTTHSTLYLSSILFFQEVLPVPRRDTAIHLVSDKVSLSKEGLEGTVGLRCPFLQFHTIHFSYYFTF